VKLSVVIPTRHRPEWLRRAVESVLFDPDLPAGVEVVVTDNSEDERSEEVAGSFVGRGVRYFRNRPPTGMVENWNEGIRLSCGDVILVLHDDDYLLPGWGRIIGRLLHRPDLSQEVHAFSVQAVTEHGLTLRRGGRHRSRQAPPQEAVRQLLTHSSLVRFPGMVVGRLCYEKVGEFDAGFAEVADLEMWLRLAAAYGNYFHRAVLSAYTIHGGALTQGMFRVQTLQTVHKLGEIYADKNLISRPDLLEARRRFFWRFVLAGAWRAWRAGRPEEVRRIMGLTRSELFSGVSCPWKWCLLKKYLERV
jgi:glycosyltransferase involved in cell wall biosynthesis